MSNILNTSVIYTVDICGNRYTSGLLDGIYISFLLVLASLIGYILFQHGKSEPIIINVYTNDEDEDEGECEYDCECYEEDEDEEEEEEEDEDEEDIIELSNEEYKLVQTLREMKTMLKEEPKEEEPKEQPKEEEPKEEEPKEQPKEQPKEEEPKEQQKTEQEQEQEQPTVTESALD